MDLGEGCRGYPPPPEMTCWPSAKKTMWFIGVEVEQETSAPPPKKILDLPLRYTHTKGLASFLASCSPG